jgi:tetratricopeptide (TPR) repeat protein
LLAETERDLDAAIRADPTLPQALDDLSAIQYARGDFESARINTERAYRADYYLQSPAILFRLFDTAFETAQDERSRHWCAMIRRRLPREWYGTHCWLMLMTWSTDDPNFAGARQLVERTIELTPVAIGPAIAAQLNVQAVGVLARTVPRDSAERVLNRVLARVSKDAPLTSNDQRVLLRLEAGVRLRMGDRDGAIELIRQYLDAVPGSRALLSNSRTFKTLFSDSRLRAPIAAR